MASSLSKLPVSIGRRIPKVRWNLNYHSSKKEFMLFEETTLKGSFLISPAPFVDDRGFFARWFCSDEFNAFGLETHFVQCNHSATFGKGSIRGLHFQRPPAAEAKLVKCISGEIFDVIIDLRENSTTFLQWFGGELSSKNKTMMYVPKGFAHGFQTLTEEAEIIYMASNHYSREAEGTIHYNDPAVDIQWPLLLNKISDKDRTASFLDKDLFKGIAL